MEEFGFTNCRDIQLKKESIIFDDLFILDMFVMGDVIDLP